MSSPEVDELRHNSAKPTITPTREDIEDFCDEWLERKRKVMGSEYIVEALNEADKWHELLYVYDYAAELGDALRGIVNAYWLHSALKAAEDADWEAIYSERME